MPEKLSVNIFGRGKRVILSHGKAELSLRGKAVQFILALVTTDFPRHLTRDGLHRLSRWQGMSAVSVGKQAARIVDLINCQLGPVVEWELKTQAWRLRKELSIKIDQAIKTEAKSLLAQESWSSILRFASVPVASMADWMQMCGGALVELTLGRADEGYRKLRVAVEIADHEEVRAISDVLATRVGQALPRPHLPVPGSFTASTFLEVAEARRLAAYARNSPSEEWSLHYDVLHRKLLRMIEVGDTSSQAILFNSLAILARRLGRMDEAVDSIREAAALSLFSGDIVLIQNVSFNFGNILAAMARIDPSYCSSESYLGLINLDIEIRRRLQIGKDSAQAELLYAFLSLERGNHDQVERSLHQADEIISISKQPLDIALFQRIRGLLLCEKYPPSSSLYKDGLAALERAIELYSSFHNKVAADEVSRDLAARREGSKPDHDQS